MGAMSTMPATDPHRRPPLTLAECDRAPELSESDYADLQRAVRLTRPIRRASGFAAFSGWGTLLAGAISLPFTLSSTPALIFCVALAGLGTRELTLRRRLRRLNPKAPPLLALNQVLLGAALIAFAVYMLVQPAGESVFASTLASDPALQGMPELNAQIASLAQIERLVVGLVCACMILVALTVQGGSAIYYLCLSRGIRRLQRGAPDWCLRVISTVQA